MVPATKEGINVRDEPLCAVCGHPRYMHRPADDATWWRRPRADGSVSLDFMHGPCGLIHTSPYHTGRPCGCRLYVHDLFPRVTELLGFEARQGIERATGACPAPRFPMVPFGDYEEGDLVTVSYEGITRAHRVRRVLPDVHDQRTYELEPVDE